MMPTEPTAPREPHSRGLGWVLAFAMLFPSVAAWLYFLVFAGSAAMAVVYSACKVVQFGLPLAWLWLGERQRLEITRPARRGLAEGIGFGLLVVALMLGLYYGFLKDSDYLAAMPAAVWSKLADFHCTTPMRYFAFALFISGLHSFLEEYYWRWFVFGRLRRLLSPGTAMVLSGTAFSLHHILVLAVYLKPEHFGTVTLPFAVCVGVGGGYWAWLYQRLGSLYSPWLSHALVDAGILFIGFDLCRGYWPS